MSDLSGRDSFLSAVSRHRPVRAIVLGSGMSSAFDQMSSICSVFWDEWPGLHARPSVKGHAGTVNLKIGCQGMACIVITGRLHRYEGHAVGLTTQMVIALAELGIRELVLTCATGGIDPLLGPGKLARIKGLIDMTDVGAWRKWAWGDLNCMEEKVAYSPLAESLAKGAAQGGLDLGQGTLAQVLGPAYETKAEIQMLRSLGAGLVGMSSGHEWRVAASMGMDAQIVALVTNWACGVCLEKIDHDAVIKESARQSTRLGAILTAD